MTTKQRQSLAASLTDAEKEKYHEASRRIRDDTYLRNIVINGVTVPSQMIDHDGIIDAALIEATKDRPKVAELGPWKPGNCEMYWAADINVETRSMKWCDTLGDERQRRFGNVFRTREEAEREARITRAWRRLRQIAAVLNAASGATLFDVTIVKSRSGDIVTVFNGVGYLSSAGQVLFAMKADAERALAQLQSEGIDIADLFL